MKQIFLIAAIFIGIVFCSCNRIKNEAKQIIDKSKTIAKETKNKIDKELNPSTIQLFERGTGLIVTDSIWEVNKTDTFFPHEGELSIVFNTTNWQIQQWIDNIPPWGNLEWQHGFVPDHVFNCKFGFEEGVSKRVILYSDGTSRTEFSGDSLLINLLQSEDLYWTSKEYCCPDSDLRYHDGQLLIIEKYKNKIWYSNWNY